MTNLSSAQEAFEHARFLVQEIGPRGSATPLEQKAAEYFAERLQNLGLQVNIQPFNSPTSAWLPIGLCILLSLFSLLLSIADTPFQYAGLILSALAVYWILREVNLDDTLLNRFLSRGKSQNVWAKIPARGSPKNKVVLLAHLDSHRTPLLMQSRFFSFIFSIFSLLGYTSVISVPIYILARIVWNIETHLPILIVLAVVLGILAFFVLQADFTPYSPGANDNAAAVGLALACARDYLIQPLENTEIWVLGTGCEEVGCYGIRRFLDQHQTELKEAHFLDFELIGRGLPSVVIKEGLLFKQKCNTKLLSIAESACHELGFPIKRQISPVYGETYILCKRRFSGITLNAMPEGKTDVYWHTPKDTLDKLDLPTLELMHRWTRSILEKIDKASL